MLETPVAFFIFNRPDLTTQVFNAIRDAAPTRLLIVADGPRNDAEWQLCHQAREIALEIDWDCEVLTNFSKENLGCRNRVSSGLNWVFENCEEAIILEDDCLPHPDFFRFCTTMLERYKNDEHVMHIAGTNFNSGFPTTNSHYFSHYAQMWGWATWQRAWKHYDVEMKLWPEFRKKRLLQLARQEKKYWTGKFDETLSGQVDTWDYQWQFDVFRKKGLVVTPKNNLISNIGFDERATHTVDPKSPFSNLAYDGIGEIDFPEKVKRNARADKKVFKIAFAIYFQRQAFPYRLARYIRRLWRNGRDKINFFQRDIV